MKSGSILTFAFAMVLFQEGCSPSAATPTPDAGLDAQAAPSEEAGPDTFCNTRRQLSFCEDFDEKSLPGAFVGFAPDASVQAEIIADPLAPSAPRALILQTTGISRGAWFRTRPLAHKGKMNALIMVRTPPNSESLTFAAFELDDNARRLELGLDAQGKFQLTELSSEGPIVHTSKVAAIVDDWMSIRWDMRVEGAITLVRLRVGDTTVFEREPLAHVRLEGNGVLAIGIASASTTPARIAIDTVTFEATNE